MARRNQLWCTALLLLTVLLPNSGLGQQAPAPMGRNVAEMKLGQVPALPTCVIGAVQNGDPSKGPSVIFGKMSAGCTIPWHWHTPNEEVIVVSGNIQVDPKGGHPLTLRPGAYLMMPSHHAHNFRCMTACSIYVHSDAAFDIHYVDAQGKEMTPDDALKAVKETAAKPPSH